jgi:uncharacterized protein YkwD
MVGMEIIFILTLLFNISSQTESAQTCISPNEKQLHELINKSRVENGLSRVFLSPSLSQVAELHSIDLSLNKPFDDRCNPHSWSAEGDWQECCYTSDHSNAECMWNKPRELTPYQGDGYEIVAFWQSGMDSNEEIGAEKAFDLWLKSDAHRNVIMNEKSFRNAEWRAVGVGIHGNYACVWFGMEEDPHKGINYCE